MDYKRHEPIFGFINNGYFYLDDAPLLECVYVCVAQLSKASLGGEEMRGRSGERVEKEREL